MIQVFSSAEINNLTSHFPLLIIRKLRKFGLCCEFHMGNVIAYIKCFVWSQLLFLTLIVFQCNMQGLLFYICSQWFQTLLCQFWGFWVIRWRPFLVFRRKKTHLLTKRISSKSTQSLFIFYTLHLQFFPCPKTTPKEPQKMIFGFSLISENWLYYLVELGIYLYVGK